MTHPILRIIYLWRERVLWNFFGFFRFIYRNRKKSIFLRRLHYFKIHWFVIGDYLTMTLFFWSIKEFCFIHLPSCFSKVPKVRRFKKNIEWYMWCPADLEICFIYLGIYIYIYIYKVFNIKNIQIFCKIFRRVYFSITWFTIGDSKFYKNVTIYKSYSLLTYFQWIY